MNPTEIYDALARIGAKPFDAAEFPFAFAEATDAAQAAISKLRSGSTNKSDLHGGVLFGKRFHYVPSPAGQTDVALDQLRASKKTGTSKPAILLATDGEMIAAEHLASGDTLHCAFTELGDQFGFFLPAAGKERYRAVEENPVDVKATGKLAKLYDALIRSNPDWGSDDRRHEMNQLMMRLIFCMFAEDVGIFPEQQFSRLIFTYAGNKGEEAHTALIAAFRAMNLPKRERAGLPAWTGELEYVNGGLFAGAIDAPHFNKSAFEYLREACGLNWREINPDIFGSMIQSVADPKQRAELGMHYTSVPNIMKVIGPLFLDDLDAEIEKGWDRTRPLQQTLDRMSRIRVFDPACGSGNFLVVSYRELRARETRVMQRLEEINSRNAMGTSEMFSRIRIDHFYGIELSDFAAETAKLALFIAEYQANASFKKVFGRCPAALPLRDSARIHTGNALRLDWVSICPPPGKDEEVFIAGNPPFSGALFQTENQKEDRHSIFQDDFKSYKNLDYSAGWFLLATRYAESYRQTNFAFVSTNSITQGRQAISFWPKILQNLKISFAHTSFQWRNNASSNAAVVCVIIGLSLKNDRKSRLFHGDLMSEVDHINPYLAPSPTIYVNSSDVSLFNLPYMGYGSMPADGGNLILSTSERDTIAADFPLSIKFLRSFMGSQEVVRGQMRHCIWIRDEDRSEAYQCSPIQKRVRAVREFRAASSNPDTRVKANSPHKFWFVGGEAKTHAILVPCVTSERRPYLPVERVGSDVISSNANQVLYDAPDWCIALIASRLHLVWIGTVCGRLESRFRYSNTLGWNTFPVPKFTEEQLEALSASARRILKCRYSHYPKTIADLYDPDDMPDDLRAVHRENDELLESMYIGRPFRNDTERLEKLFKLYAARVKTLEATPKKKTKA